MTGIKSLKVKPILGGIVSYVPGLIEIYSKIRCTETVCTKSARYCYSVWLRHLSMAFKNGISYHPKVIVELGPGKSIGTGLAALITGADKYYAFDAVKLASNKCNIEVFDELVELFMKREGIPDHNELPKVKPYLESYEFPYSILNDNYLRKMLHKDRIAAIRYSILNCNYLDQSSFKIFYFAPWPDYKILTNESVDMIFSQAVMEYIQDIELTYKTMYNWLKPKGVMSHQIDFKSDGSAKAWNGHWTYSDFVWKLMNGKRKASMINRQPYSKHINLIKKIGFELICDLKMNNFSGIQRKDLAPRFKDLSDEDLLTSGVFIQAVKK